MQDIDLAWSRTVIDLKFDEVIRSARSPGRRHEQRTKPIFATHRPLTQTRVSSVRATLRWQPSDTQFFLLGSVSVHDVRAVDLPRESARHRGLPAFATTAALSSGNSWPRLTRPLGRGPRNPQLADRRRFRATHRGRGWAPPSGRRVADHHSPPPLR